MGVDTTLIIGSGALENAWSPVYRAIKKVTSLDLNNPDLANLVMARLIFNVRFFNDAVAKCSEKVRVQAEISLNESREYLRNFRNCLADELRKSSADREVFLRKDQIKIVKSHLKGEFSIVTTNWDVESAKILGNSILIPLHGSFENPDGLYLPAEASFDRNSSIQIERQHAATHFAAAEHIGSAFVLIFWGLGINALDAELTVVLSTAFHEKLSRKLNYRVVIVDRDPMFVARKLQMFGVDEDKISHVIVEV